MKETSATANSVIIIDADIFWTLHALMTIFVSQRFFPSEFGNDVDRTDHAVEPAKTSYATKAKLRRTIEAEGIPHTYVACNFFAGHFLPNLSQLGATAAPRDEVVILGDGNPKGKNLKHRFASTLEIYMSYIVLLTFA